jgi:putative SOS response-associated peptidase YedK
MPLVLPSAAYSRWLSPLPALPSLVEELTPQRLTDWQFYPISNDIAKPNLDYPTLLEPVSYFRQGGLF